MEYLQRVWHASRERLPFRTPGSFPLFWDLLMLQLLGSDFPNLPCLYSTFHLEYPSVLSRFCSERLHKVGALNRRGPCSGVKTGTERICHNTPTSVANNFKYWKMRSWILSEFQFWNKSDILYIPVSWRYHLYMFNDTSRYSPSTILNFWKQIPDIYPTELQLNKPNTSDKENSFLDLNIKVIGSGVHTSVYDKRNDFGLMMFLDSHHTVFS